MGDYEILEDISANSALFQLMDSLVNVNHDISVVGNWIFDSKYERALVLNRASLDMICAPYFGEVQADKFESVFTSVKIHLNFSAIKEGIVLMYQSKHNHIQSC